MQAMCADIVVNDVSTIIKAVFNCSSIFSNVDSSDCVLINFFYSICINAKSYSKNKSEF